MAGLTTRHLALFSYLITPFACDGVHIALKMVYLLTLRVMSDCCAQTDTLRRICCRLYRAQVGVAASSGDWSKRIRDMQYTDHEDYTVGS